MVKIAEGLGRVRSLPCSMRSEFEHHAKVVSAAGKRSAIEVASAVRDQACYRHHSFFRLGKAIQYRLFAGPIYLEHGPEASSASELGGAIEVAGRIPHQPSVGIGSIRPPDKVV